MRALLTGILVGVLCCFSSAQDVLSLPHTNDTASRNQDSEGTNSSSTKRKTDAERIAAGSVILVELTRTIDAKKTKNGDAVEAKVTQDLKASHGEIVVPKNTEVTGHITETQARSKEQKESEVGIAFDHVLMKNGSSETLPMSIQAVIAPTFLNASGPANNNTPMKIQARRQWRRKLAETCRVTDLPEWELRGRPPLPPPATTGHPARNPKRLIPLSRGTLRVCLGSRT